MPLQKLFLALPHGIGQMFSIRMCIRLRVVLLWAV
jgi:hypothetical protein